MPLRALFAAQLIVVAILGALHVGALSYSLYWQYPWLDVLSHFLGGLWVALALLWIAHRFGVAVRGFYVFLGVLVVGLGWEVFEVVAGIPRESNWLFDTAIDLIMDLLGALVGIVWSKRLL
ncbi:MAG: hypothetical protein KBE09_00045 [Candidatus Pacebacteria bacterium]|nr:hypothetical protein [Candidatus Paceibacterota bacterium]